MSGDLLLMASSDLPRNGIVLLADPYRDVYGRNCLATTYAADLTPMSGARVTVSGESIRETADTNTHNVYASIASSNVPNCFALRVKPNGRTRIWVSFNDQSKWVVFALEGAGSIAGKEASATASISLGADGYYRCAVCGTPTNAILSIGFLPDGAVNLSGKSYAGDITKGAYFATPQLNLGQLFPYSAPAGAPGTLQTSLDYSGNGNHLTLGASTSAGADDPSFTGVSIIHATDDIVLSSALSGVAMAGDWSIPIICKPGGTAGAIVSLADATAADQYQAIEFNGSTKVRIHTKNGATDTYSDDLTVSASAVQMLSLVSSGGVLTLKRMDTATSVTANNALPTGTPRLVIGAVGTSTIGGLASALEWNYLPLYGWALPASVETRIYRLLKSKFAGRGVTVA